MLAIRRSSPLFRLRTGEEVRERLRFYNTGPSQIPGLIVMTVADAEGSIDRRFEQVVVAINAVDETRAVPLPIDPCPVLELHPLQVASQDAVVRTSAFDPSDCELTVPARTAAVFVDQRGVEEQLQLLQGDVLALVSAGTLNDGQGHALLVKLANALERYQAGNTKSALGALQAFIHQVEDFIEDGVLGPPEGEPLLAAAQTALEAMAG